MAATAGVVQTTLGITAGALVLAFDRIALLPLVVLAWPVIAGGMRRLDVVVVHQTLHGMFTASDMGNRVMSEIITTLLWRLPYEANRREHLLHHAYPCSTRDGDTSYLLSTSVRPGMTRREFRRYLVRALVSPRHHWSFFSSRIKGNYFSRLPIYRIVMSFAYLTATVTLLVVTGWWPQWLLLWFIPVTFFFQNQTFLYTLSEHRWWLFGNAERLTRAQRDQLTFGRFCGLPAPRPARLERPRDQAAGPNRAAAELRHALRMAAWWTRMVLVYTPYRLCILVGDTVQHDLHHIRPRCDWANSAWERNNELAGNRADRFYEAWGGLLTHVYIGNSVRDFSAKPSVPLAPAAV